MTRSIVLFEGHPDPSPERFGHALANAYAEAAVQAGHEIHRIAIGAVDFPLLRSKSDYENGPVPDAVRAGQEALLGADHLVLMFPLWMGGMPAVTKAYLEQLFRSDFAFNRTGGGRPRRAMTGRSARVVVTMGMPALFYRWYFGAHSLKSLERNILKFCGISPVHESLIGRIDSMTAHDRTRWLERMAALGAAGR